MKSLLTAAAMAAVLGLSSTARAQTDCTTVPHTWVLLGIDCDEVVRLIQAA